MSRWHREHPDYEETGEQPPDPRDLWDMRDKTEQPIHISTERPARDVRDQRDRGSFYERQFHRLINDIQEIIDRPEKVADYVQDHDDIQDVLTRARQARW